jgi:hypothetical protein
MSSIQDLENKRLDLSKKYRFCRNETTKLDLLRQMEEISKEILILKENGAAKKPVEAKEVQKPEPVVIKEQKKEPENDLNRGKVAELGSSIPEDKKDNNKKNNK